MSRPRLLDLFCGAGGCSVGYHRAGFDVVGVDLAPQPRYPFKFHQADAFDVLADLIWAAENPLPFEIAPFWDPRRFDVIHASPPCQDHSDIATVAGTHGTGWMLDATRRRLIEWGGPYVIENVDSAPMPGALMLCGAAFGLHANGRTLRRHRLFESNVHLMGQGCACSNRVIGFYGTGGPGQMRRGYKGTMAEARTAMGIDWMTRAELSQAIPPAYTEFIGAQLLDHVRAAA